MERVMLPKRKISVPRTLGWVACTLISLCFAYFYQPKFHGNSNAITALTTIFSVLAGFLIAVMAIAADERVLRGRTWRHDVGYLELVKRDLRKHRSLFYLYLSVLTLVLASAFNPPLEDSAQIFIERVLLFLSSMALLLSFRLPIYLTKRHIDSLDAIIKQRREDQRKR